MDLAARGIETNAVDAIRSGGRDANDQVALRQIAEGHGNPCRHCLQLIPAGEPLLVLGFRPFAQSQPYAEVGPIFLHSTKCDRYEGKHLPEWFTHLQPALFRGYDHKDWIRYETGAVVPGEALEVHCQQILQNPDVAYIHIRSKFNCFQCRVERG